MSRFKVVLLGVEQTGKTTMSQKLRGLPISKEYRTTIGVDFNTIKVPNHNGIDNIHVALWDTPSDHRYKSMNTVALSNVDLGIYCIDLSQEITKETLISIKSDINELQTRSPNAQLILVGTKNDITLPNALETVSQKLAEVPFKKIISTSSHVNEGLDDLYDYLISWSHNKYIQEQIKFYKEKNQINGILHARNLSNPNSELYQALDNLYHQSKDLDAPKSKALGDLTTHLMFSLLDIQVADKMGAINSFVQQSDELLHGRHSGILNTILVIATSAAVTVIAALIGFGIGFALGSWSGPGAFFTGLLAGCTSAIAVAGSSSVLGLATLSYSAYHFFKPSPTAEAVSDLAEKAKASTFVAPN
ncbi:Rab family GTPase [Legionella fallonii]|uniref:Rho GTPase (Miro-like) n=1 Tax=Legionella fallonii LLAP-10 TaxID=1212491 RepID=A0A098G3R6_9GAMM|nr:GTP-binding protein [Legionella fallonii]CEG57117.1 protein of unknown function [Legionella fallonii LLAP-10]